MKTTREMIEVMEAHERGENIEMVHRYMSGAVWDETSDPGWNWIDFDYRVSPKPRECWAIFTAGNNVRMFASKAEAEKHHHVVEGTDSIVQMREVYE